MDFPAIFQLRTKKFWWMDVIFYFVISLLVATLLCYVIFLVKNSIQRQDIEAESAKLMTIGTNLQKEHEKYVLDYKSRIVDFSSLLKNHEFASNAFAFMQSQTMPNVWFKQFSLDKNSGVIQLSGESDNMDAFSRQVAVFEKNEYVKSLGTLSSSLGDSARTAFNTNITFNKEIFSYLNNSRIAEAAKAAAEEANETTVPETPAETISPVGETTLPSGESADQPAAEESSGTTKSSEKLITAFHLLLNPDVIGAIDNQNHKVILSVPYGTNLGNLDTSIIISPEASVVPASGVPQNFVNPIIYRVTAEDGSIQAYEVAVNVLPESVKTSDQSGRTIMIFIILISVVIAVVAVAILFIWKKSKSKKAVL